MRIVTTMTSKQAVDAITDGETFIIYKGKIVGEESFKADSSGGRDVAEISLEKAFKDDGRKTEEIDAVLTKVNLDCSDSTEVPCTAWIDRSELKGTLEGLAAAAEPTVRLASKPAEPEEEPAEPLAPVAPVPAFGADVISPLPGSPKP